MKQTYLNMNGEIENLTYKEIKARTNKNISWARMNYLVGHKVDCKKNKAIYDFIKRYLGKVSVFDFNNMVEWGHLFLYPHFVDLALKNGAKDLRKELIK